MLAKMILNFVMILSGLVALMAFALNVLSFKQAQDDRTIDILKIEMYVAIASTIVFIACIILKVLS